MQQALHTLTVPTDGTGLYEMTDEIAGWLAGTGILTLPAFGNFFDIKL